ncbi:MAG: hypothetical protein NVS2B8_10130 [Vulcanimicrobiaceae bacterium]
MTIEDSAARCRDGNAPNLIRAGGCGEPRALHELDLRESYDERDECDQDDERKRDDLPFGAREGPRRFSDGAQARLPSPAGSVAR